MGFDVRFTLADTVTDADIDAFWDVFIRDVIEANDLACGGRCGRTWSIFVTRAGRGSACEEDRQRLLTWLQQHPHVSEPYVGPLVDAWYAS